MSGNSFGKSFVVTSFRRKPRQCHRLHRRRLPAGAGAGRVGPAGMTWIDVNRVPRGTPRSGVKMTCVQILSGTFRRQDHGYADLPADPQQDQRSKDYSDIKDLFRPGHADYSYTQKYGFRDYRGGGRSSARETAMRVAAGGIAKKYLASRCGIQVRGYLSQLGPLKPVNFDWNEVDNNSFFCADAAMVPEMEKYMDALRKEGESVGAKISIVASGVPSRARREPIFDRIDADIAHAMMSINAVKGVEIGAGFASIELKGTQNRDEITPPGFYRTMPAARSVESPPVRMSWSALRSNRRRVSTCPAKASMSTATRSISVPRVDTIPASAFAPRRSPKPCSRSC